MIHIGQIRHPNKTTDAKAKIFYDYFQNFLSRNEYLLLKNQPLNNHLTILQKIDFRLSNEQLSKSSRKVINNLLNNNIFNTGTDRISRKPAFKTIIKGIKTLLTAEKVLIGELKLEIEKAVILINDSYDYNKTVYLDKCIDELTSYLSSVHEFSIEKENIIYYTQLISSEFIRHNFQPEELTGSNSLLKKILSNEIRVDSTSNYTYTDFPLSPEIEISRENTDVFNKKVEDFISQRTLSDQLKGIVNYLQKNKAPSFFIVRILNADSSEELNIPYGKAEIFSQTHYDKIKSKLPENCHFDLEQFGDKDDCLYIKIPLEYKSRKNGIRKAFSEAENILSYLNYPNEAKGFIDRGKIIEIFSDGINYNNNYNKLTTKQGHEYILDKTNTDEKIYLQLSNLDKLYFKAFTSNLMEDKIVNAWRYLEILGDHGRIKNDKKRINELPYILLNTVKENTQTQLDSLIFNLIHNNQEIVNANISRYEYPKILKGKIDIQYLKNETDYNFTNELISISENLTINYADCYKLYKTQFELLYEQRNYILHQSNICPIDIDSFIVYIQILLKRIRKSIFDEVNLSDDANLENVIKQLITTGKQKKE